MTSAGGATAGPTTAVSARRRWPLLLLAAPAAVSIWSGWVGLGGMAGFGLVHPLPGIADGFTINSAIALPIGVEAYSAYALGTWLSSRPMAATARRFAGWSSLAGLVLGMVGQVIYHLLSSAGHQQAPSAVVVFVACLPVLVLGAGATLHHLLADEVVRPASKQAAGPVQDEQANQDRSVSQAGRPGRGGDERPGLVRSVRTDAELLDQLRALARTEGRPSRNRAARALRVGSARAARLLDHLDQATVEQAA